MYRNIDVYYILRQVRKHDLHYLATLQSAQCSMSALSLLSLQLSLSIILTATDLRDGVFRPDLVNISDIKMTGDQYIHTGMILTNVQGKTKHFQNNLTVEFQMVDKISKIVLQFKRMLHSLFLYSKGTPLHFIFLTDEESLETIKNCFKQEIGKYLSESIIYSLSWRNKDTIFKFPKLDVEFVDIDSVTTPNREEIERLKEQYGHHPKPGTVFKPLGDDGPGFVQSYKGSPFHSHLLFNKLVHEFGPHPHNL